MPWCGPICATPTVHSSSNSPTNSVSISAWSPTLADHDVRAKATRYADHTVVTVYATALGPQVPGSIESRLLLSKLSIFVLPTAVVTVRHETDSAKPVFDITEVVRRWDDNADLLRRGSAALLHGVLDVVVDGHFDTIQQLDDAIESLEDNLFDDRSQNRQLQRDTYRLRKELVELRRVVLPMREVVNTVMRRSVEGTDTGELTNWYYDLYDHVIRASEWTDSLRDMVTTVFETNLSLQDARLNTIMKKLTGWAAIIAVPTLVTGWFGQNIPYPGYGNDWGVLTSAVVSVLTSVALYLGFRATRLALTPVTCRRSSLPCRTPWPCRRHGRRSRWRPGRCR